MKYIKGEISHGKLLDEVLIVIKTSDFSVHQYFKLKTGYKIQNLLLNLPLCTEFQPFLTLKFEQCCFPPGISRRLPLHTTLQPCTTGCKKKELRKASMVSKYLIQATYGWIYWIQTSKTQVTLYIAYFSLDEYYLINGIREIVIKKLFVSLNMLQK